MTQTAANVMVAGSGAIFHAPLATTLPTTAFTALNAAFKDVGYVSEDGVTESQGAESNPIKAWGGDTVRTVQTAHNVTYRFSMIETNDESVALFYGNGTAASHVINGDVLEHQEFVLDMLDGDAVIRIVIPDGQITERGEVVYASGGAMLYPVTITCYPDDSGNKAYKYIDADGVS